MDARGAAGRASLSQASDPEVRMLRLAAGGDGVGQLADGRTVFVPRTAPGDLVRLSGVRLQRRFGRARVGQILESGPDRVEPRCPHYVKDDCGGCQLQHLSAAAQLATRRAFVGDALRRLAKIDVPDPEIVPAPRMWEYRTKLTLHRSDDGRRIGLHRYHHPTDVFELDWCHITSAALNELWRAVRQHRRLLPPGLERLVLRLDRRGGRHLVLRVARTEVWSGGPALAETLARDGAAVTVWWRPERGAARAVGGTGEAYPATVFEQVHPEMGDQARRFALSRLGSVAGRHVWDLYAGIGETSERLLAAGASVESVEVDPLAVALASNGDADSRAASDHASSAIVRHVGRVEDVIGRLRPPVLVVTNPPRTGMDERAIAGLAGVAPAPERIVYLSCDPPTLARDIGRLAATYRVAEATAFDLFPQTAHVETVAVLERR